MISSRLCAPWMTSAGFQHERFDMRVLLPVEPSRFRATTLGAPAWVALLLGVLGLCSCGGTAARLRPEPDYVSVPLPDWSPEVPPEAPAPEEPPSEVPAGEVPPAEAPAGEAQPSDAAGDSLAPPEPATAAPRAGEVSPPPAPDPPSPATAPGSRPSAPPRD